MTMPMTMATMAMAMATTTTAAMDTTTTAMGMMTTMTFATTNYTNTISNVTWATWVSQTKHTTNKRVPFFQKRKTRRPRRSLTPQKRRVLPSNTLHIKNTSSRLPIRHAHQSSLILLIPRFLRSGTPEDAPAPPLWASDVYSFFAAVSLEVWTLFDMPFLLCGGRTVRWSCSQRVW